MRTPIKKKNRRYTQGIFNPKNPSKYKGSLPIYYRSSLELKAYRMLDDNPNVLTWGSESVVIPYQSPLDGRLHRYFVDIVASLKDKNNVIQKLLIEVKPLKFTMPPVNTPLKSPKTIMYEKVQYTLNQAKFAAAKQWCKNKNYQFIILTEKEIARN